MNIELLADAVAYGVPPILGVLVGVVLTRGAMSQFVSTLKQGQRVRIAGKVFRVEEGGEV